jgi:PAS domain S-box-containing protein
VKNNFVFLEQALRHPLMVAPEIPLDEVIALMGESVTKSCFLTGGNAEACPVSLGETSAYSTSALAREINTSEVTSVGIGCVLAIAQTGLIGIFTERELVKLIASGRDLKGLTLADVMNRQVITLAVTESQGVLAALDLFHRYQIHHLPVIDERAKLLGLMTPASLRQALQTLDLLKFRRVRDVMSRAIHAAPNASILQVAQLMNDYQVDCIAIAQPLGHDSTILRPLGIITERDILQFQILELNLAKLRAETVMSTPLFAVDERDSLWRVHQLTSQHRVSRLVAIGQQKELLGIVTQHSLLQAIDTLELQQSLTLLQERLLHLEAEKTKSLERRNLDLERQLQQQATQLQERSRQEQLVAAIALKIRQSLNLPEVLQRTVEEVRELIQADRVLIYRFDANRTGIVTTEATSDPQWSILEQVIRDACFERAWIDGYQQGHITANANIYQSQLSPCHIEFLEQFQVKANIAVPILLTPAELAARPSNANYLWGLLIVHQCFSPRNWQQSELNLLQMLAIQVAIAIQQSELYQQTQNELARRKQAEKILKEQEELFRVLVTSAPAGIFQTDIQGECLYVNQCWQDITGLSLAAALGRGWSEALHPDDRDLVLNEWYDAARSGREFNLEYRLVNPQGRITWVAGRAVPLYNQRAIAGYLGTVSDINGRKQAELALQDSEAQLRTALEAADLGTWIWEMATDTIVLSEYAQSILGYAPGEFPGTLEAILSCIHPNDRSALEQKIQQLFSEGGLYDVEQRIVRQDGSIGWISVRGHILRDESDRPIRMTGVIADITQKKQLESQFLRNQRLESLGALAGGIAHDLNNILTPIMMSVQLLPLTLPDVDERSQELIQMLDSNVNRGSALVRQILSFARGIEGDRGALQIGYLIADIKQMIQETFPKSIVIQTDISRDLWTVYGDATQIHQVLLNLAVNARDAMPDGGTLELTARNISVDSEYVRQHRNTKVGSHVEITVSDTGVGIPPDSLKRIFEPFFTTKEANRGTGLGLATVFGIVKNHRGAIEVQSDLGRGTKFTILLPATSEIPTETTESPAIPKGRGESILVVDDEATIREITKASLETHNYRVITANNGIEAIALYVRHQTEIAVILMNMLMPSMSGTTAIRTLQKIDPQVNIIAISGRNFSQQDFRDRELNIKAFLAKPYNTETLLRTISEVLQHSTE